EDRRAITRAVIVPLPVDGRRVVDLEEELEDVAIRRLLGIEDDLDRLGMRSVIPVRRVCDVASGVSHPRQEDAGPLPDQILHPPEAPAGQDRLLGRPAHLTLLLRVSIAAPGTARTTNARVRRTACGPPARPAPEPLRRSTE